MLSRIKELFRQFVMPKTLEQSIGIFMLFTAAVLILRPFAAGLEDLYTNYALVVTVQAFGSITALCGVVFLALKRVGRKTFWLLFLPVPTYTLCLFLFFLRGARVGPLGWLGFFALVIAVSWMYGIRAARRESERL